LHEKDEKYIQSIQEKRELNNAYCDSIDKTNALKEEINMLKE